MTVKDNCPNCTPVLGIHQAGCSDRVPDEVQNDSKSQIHTRSGADFRNDQILRDSQRTAAINTASGRDEMAREHARNQVYFDQSRHSFIAGWDAGIENTEDSLDSEVVRLWEENQRLASVAEGYRLNWQECEAEIKRLREQLDESRSDVAPLEEKLQAAYEEIGRLRAALENARALYLAEEPEQCFDVLEKCHAALKATDG